MTPRHLGRALRAGITTILAASAALFAAWPASAATVFDPLTLLNGWTGGPQGTRAPGISRQGNLVHLRGAMAGGTNSVEAFRVPLEFRPLATVLLRVTVCGGKAGRLQINPDGAAYLRDEDGVGTTDVTCFTSLDDVSYTVDTAGFTPVTPENGWRTSVASPAGVSDDNGIVRFRGTLSGGTTSALFTLGALFTLPPSFRPSEDVYIPITLGAGAPGRLRVQPNGLVTVIPRSTRNLTAAQTLTSLEGASFARAGTGFSRVTLVNGWLPGPFGTAAPGFRNDNGIVHLKGAVSGGTAGTLFTLPASMRPASPVEAAVDLCSAVPGRIRIGSDGVVEVLSSTTFADAQCFTSLEGVAFAVASFTPLSLQNGWRQTAITGRPGVVKQGNVVSFTGGLTAGNLPEMFTLPASMRPATDVYVSVSLCNGERGRLRIQPDGVTSIEAETVFADARCLASLDGASFMIPGARSVPLTLQNGWLGGALNTSAPVAQRINGIVRLAGAVSGGTNAVVLTLPTDLRPSTDVAVPVNVCNARKGRLLIQPSGVVRVQAENAFSDARCFTSLDGVEFAPLPSPATTLVLQNGWTGQALNTAVPKARDINGIVHLSGAVAGGTTNLITVLPPQFRPFSLVYADADLCNAAKGRVVIAPDGSVRVSTQGGFSNPQCFTSLDGVSYAP